MRLLLAPLLMTLAACGTHGDVPDDAPVVVSVIGPRPPGWWPRPAAR